MLFQGTLLCSWLLEEVQNHFQRSLFSSNKPKYMQHTPYYLLIQNSESYNLLKRIIKFPTISIKSSKGSIFIIKSILQSKTQIQKMNDKNRNLLLQRKYHKPIPGLGKCQLCDQQYSSKNKAVQICQDAHKICQKCVDFFRQQYISITEQQRKNSFCPFCFQPLKWINFIEKHPIEAQGYKEIQNQTKIVYRMPEKSQLSFFEKLSGQNYKYIMRFLSQKQKINLVSTSMFLRYLLMQSNYWGEFEISDVLSMDQESQDFKRNWKSRLQWIKQYFPVIKPQELRIMIREKKVDKQLMIFFLNVFPWVNKVTLFCESIQIHLLIAKACPNVVTLNVSSEIFSDQLFEKMATSMKKIKHFQIIKDDPNFTAKDLSKRFPEGLERIIMKVHMIEFKQIALIAKINPDLLTQIEIDLQQCDEQILVDILESLTSVEVLKLYHMENIHIPQKIAKSMSTKVRELYLTKAYDMPMRQIIEKVATPKLLTLDFTEVNLLDDKDIQLLTKNCPYLRRINVSWCNKVSQQAIAALIQSCTYLQIVNLTGVKCLTDKAFKQYNQLLGFFDESKYDSMKHQISKAISKKQSTQTFSVQTIDFIKNYQNQNNEEKMDSLKILKRIQKIKSLRNAKELSCISCNGISDKILKFIYLVNRKVNTINYYSTEMGLFAYDEFGEQTWY